MPPRGRRAPASPAAGSHAEEGDDLELVEVAERVPVRAGGRLQTPSSVEPSSAHARPKTGDCSEEAAVGTHFSARRRREAGGALPHRGPPP